MPASLDDVVSELKELRATWQNLREELQAHAMLPVHEPIASIYKEYIDMQPGLAILVQDWKEREERRVEMQQLFREMRRVVRTGAVVVGIAILSQVGGDLGRLLKDLIGFVL